MEHISGPFNGFFIATRVTPSRDAQAGYLAHSKICRGKPASFRDAYCCATVTGAKAFPTQQEACADAEKRARAQTCELAPFAFAKPPRIQQYADAS